MPCIVRNMTDDEAISTESMKNDVAVAQRLGITATTLDGILTVKRQGRR